MTLQEAESLTILRGTVGSVVSGLSIAEVPDRDEMAICIEPLSEAMGLGAPFEQLVYRSASERTGQHDAPSEGGDLDLTIYSLRKYLRLALKGNPTVLTLLFLSLEKGQLSVQDARGSNLQALRPYIISRQAGKAFLGYLQAQRQRMLGERGNGGHGKPRGELTEKYGFDTKFAMHMLRLGFQGVELLETGSLSFPMKQPSRDYLIGVRRGEASIQDCLTKAGELEAHLKDLLDSSPLQAEPVVEPVEEFMLRTYFYAWSSRRAHDQWPDPTLFWAASPRTDK